MLIAIQGNLYPQQGADGVAPGGETALHSRWDRLLQAHVGEDGRVDYRGFLDDRDALSAYLQTLAGTPPEGHWTNEARLAYFINLYNAGTIALILEHYPVKSIRDIDRPWAKKWIFIGDTRYSLGDIEHKILRKMGDPRIHFAIVCASVSCPRLQARAFTEAEVDTQLQEAARSFVNDPQRNRFGAGEAEVSKIFQWFRKDFVSPGTSLIDYLNAFLDKPLEAGTPVQYLPYDWALNE